MSIEVGNKVKYTDDNNSSYAGIVITYDDSNYFVSLEGSGKIISTSDSNLEVIN